MSPGVLFGSASVLTGALIWAASSISMTRANPDQRTMTRASNGWRLFQVIYVVAFVLGVMGVIVLNVEVGWWVVFPCVALLVGPQLIIVAVHRRQVARRTART